jgi:hypothetical protein
MCSGSAGRNRDLSLNSALLKTMILLPIVTKAAAGQEMGPGWNLLILHHTDCGIKGCYKHAPDLLAIHMHVTREELDALEVSGLGDCCSETGLASRILHWCAASSIKATSQGFLRNSKAIAPEGGGSGTANSVSNQAIIGLSRQFFKKNKVAIIQSNAPSLADPLRRGSVVRMSNATSTRTPCVGEFARAHAEVLNGRPDDH